VPALALPRPISLALSPLAALRAWPADLPLAAILSGAPHAASPRSRWSILARPRDWQPILSPAHLLPPARLAPAPDPDPDLPAFTGGWIGALHYELGAALEPAAAAPGAGNAPLPLGGWARCDSALVHDNRADRWWLIGDPDELPVLDELTAPASFTFPAPLRSESGRDAYQRAVARAVEYIRAGDVFQVNLAHTLRGRMRGSPRALFAALARSASPWYGAYLETPDAVIASASPELFLDYDAISRRVVTRPMKGTRAGEHTAAELLASEKDAAELNMIVDLMRNDLGRVCEFGSLRVDAPREVESHGALQSTSTPGILQGVATVSGTVRADQQLPGLLRAAFPPGSITGAPKVRAMQIISELEPLPRGPYCGCIGFLSDSGRAQFSVAIRTAVLTKAAPSELWNVRYGIGAGIVADSDPGSEWRETLIKARIWRGIADIADE
jgi:para-aminobenzoate synthetase component 1